MAMIANAYHLGLADGPTEVHKVTLARTLLSKATPAAGLFPTRHIPAEREAAHTKYADVLAQSGSWLRTRSPSATATSSTSHASTRTCGACSTSPTSRCRSAAVHGGPGEPHLPRTGRRLELVLRRPPRGKLAPGAHDMAREHRVLSLLCRRVPTRAPEPALLRRRHGHRRAVHRDRAPSRRGRSRPRPRTRSHSITTSSVASTSRSSMPPPICTRSTSPRTASTRSAPATTSAAARSRAGLRAGDRGSRRRIAAAMDAVAERLLDRCPMRRDAGDRHNDLKLDNCQFTPPTRIVTDRSSTGTWRPSATRSSIVGLLLVSMSAGPVWVLTAEDAVATLPRSIRDRRRPHRLVPGVRDLADRRRAPAALQPLSRRRHD